MDTEKSISGQRGFTLIEIIASLVLISIGTVLLGSGIVYVTRGYSFAKINAATSQKGQVALTRVGKELTAIGAVNSGTATAINFVSYKDGVAGTRSLSWAGSAGDPLLLDGDALDGVGGDTLADGVSNLVLAYYDTYDAAPQASWSSTCRVIGVTLTLQGAENVDTVFTMRIAPRNLL